MMIHLVDRFEDDKGSRLKRRIDKFFSRLTWFVEPTSNNVTCESVDELKKTIEFLTTQLRDVNEKVIELQAAYEYEREKARNLEYEKVQECKCKSAVAHNERATVVDTSILGLYASF